MADLAFETIHKLTVKCDSCDKSDSVTHTQRGKLAPMMKADGWKIVRSRKGGTVAICPKCTGLRAEERIERKKSIEAAVQAKREALAKYRQEHERIYGMNRSNGP